MKVIGIDPGTQTTGYGVVSIDNSKLTCHQWGVIKTDKGAKIQVRLKQIFDGVKNVIAEHRPDCMALEETFFAKNAQSALKLGLSRGVIMLAAEEAGIETYEYSPLLIKQSVTGYGRADKKQVRDMVMHILALTKEPKPYDASDALAIAITHTAHAGFMQRATQ